MFDKERTWQESIRAKLRPFEPRPVPSWENFLKCCEETMYRTCRGCGLTKALPYRCCLKWCPVCGSWLSYIRKDKIKSWAQQVTQPKHVVLTMRNTETFSGKQIRKFRRALVSLRRGKLFREVRGGCATLEVTNESRGWHLHAHLLLDVRWLDAGDLAREWAKRIGQDFAIVKVKDCREKVYLQEVSKYVVKGSELASWSAEEIRQFIWALHKRRTFFTFGTLQKPKPNEKREPAECECGCQDFIFESLVASIIREARQK